MTVGLIRRAADDAASSLFHNMIVNPADGNKATAASTIDTGNTDTGGKASTPPTDMTIDSTNNPTGLDGTIPTGPNDDIHVANSNTAASPTPEQPNDDTHVINSDAATSLTLTDTITTMQPNPGPQTTNEPEPPQLPPPTERITLDNNDENGNGPSATTIRGSRKRKYSPAKMARHQALYDQARIARHDADSPENNESDPACSAVVSFTTELT